MPKELRAELHERFAAWLEKAAGDRVVEYEEILGFHLEQAYRYRTELAPPDEASAELAGKAVERLSSAAQRALTRVDMPATIALLERSLALLPEDDSRRARFLCDLGYALRERGALEAAETTLKSAITAAEEVGDPALRALADVRLTAVGTQRGGGMEDAAAKLEQLTGELERLGDEAALAEAFFIFGQHLSWTGQEASATRALEKAAEIARRLGDARLESRTLGWIAIDAFWLRVPVEDGLQICGQELGRPGANRLGQSALLIMDGNLKYMAGRKEEGLAEVAAGQALMEELGRDLERHAFRMATGLVLLLAGEFRRAEEELEPGCEGLRAMGERGYLSTAAAELALSLCWQGRHDEAESLVEESKELGAADDLTTQVYWRGALAQVLATRGEHDRAVDLTGEAIGLLERGDRLLDLCLVTLSAAEVYRTAGRLDESRRMLQRALELCRQKGNVSGEAWVERLLAEG
jgi:tetratricopeptide (TPR) repeat protein